MIVLSEKFEKGFIDRYMPEWWLKDGQFRVAETAGAGPILVYEFAGGCFIRELDTPTVVIGRNVNGRVLFVCTPCEQERMGYVMKAAEVVKRRQLESKSMKWQQVQALAWTHGIDHRIKGRTKAVLVDMILEITHRVSVLELAAA